MMNLFKMDFHRFIRNKMMYVLLFIFAVFQAFGTFMIGMNADSILEGGHDVSAMNASEYIQFVLSNPPAWILMYIMVFTVYFYISEQEAGYYKNYITTKDARKHSVLSKIMIQLLFTIIMFATLLIADFIARPLFLDTIAVGDIGYLVKLLSGQILIHWAFSAVMLCIAILTKKMLFAIGIGVALVLNVFGMIVSAIENLLFDGLYVAQFLIVNNIMGVRDFNDWGETLHLFGVGIGFIIVFMSISIYLKMREDLK